MSATLITDGSRRNAHGFTLIEIIAVLVIIGIMSAVAITIFSSLDKYKLTSEVEILKTHLRYAQSRAMSDTVSWGIYFSGGPHYTLQRNGDPISYPSLPNENSNTHNLQGGFSVSGLPVIFDNFGSPGVADIDITVGTRLFTVTANTGFIP